MSDLYQTQEWKSIRLSERAYLLPTAEDIRPGALIKIINSQAEALEYCLERKGMKSYKKNGLWFVSKDKKFLEDVVKKWKSASKSKPSLPTNKGKKKYHTSIGKFFGYPECCVEDFIGSLDSRLLPGREWRNKARKAFEQGIYNDIFDYAFHVPCDIDCKGTQKMAKQIKKVLELYDLEAAEWIKEFNHPLLREE